MRNLAAWAATAAWSEETSGERRLISSETGDGLDAVRILLPETDRPPDPRAGRRRPHPHRHPRAPPADAATLRPGDEEFAGLFAEFIIEESGGADEPVDRRVFELVDGRLVDFAGMTDGLRVEVDGAVVTLTLDRPEALNALTVPLKVALLEALTSLGADRAVRAIILTGAGRAFCAGQDLAERAEPGCRPARRRAARALQPDRRRDACHGPAGHRGGQRGRGRGGRLAGLRRGPADRRGRRHDSCWRSAGSGSLPDSGATWTLPRLVGPAWAAELALVGEPIDGGASPSGSGS